MKFISTLFFIVISASCGIDTGREPGGSAIYLAQGYHFPYHLDTPDGSWKLSASLTEVSGLGWLDEGRLACVQDENAIIYILNLESGEIELELGFGKDGDYEGIEIIGRDAWVLKSNGNLYEVKDFLGGKPPVVHVYKTDLSKKNDAEGLAYDSASNGLLIALKGHPFADGRDGRGKKAIYRFDLEARELDPEPFLLIPLDTIVRYRDYGGMARLGNRIMSTLDPAEGDRTFQPSGIAIHPESGDMYVLSAVGRLLLVFSGEGEMLAMARLSQALFFQPEGICFDPQGNLFIASEGGGGSGMVVVFSRQ